MTTTKIEPLKLLLSGLAFGDQCGISSEFAPQSSIPGLYKDLSAKGWPFCAVGGGPFAFQPNQWSDDTDMALCIVRSFIEEAAFDPQSIAAHFVGWLHTNPRDVGGMTRRTLTRLSKGVPWHEAGYEEFKTNPHNSPNGALMRNGVIPAMADSLEQAFEYSLKQGIITHYNPLSVLCCAMQTWMIWKLLNDKQWPFKQDDWKAEFYEAWSDWREGSKDPHVGIWFHRVEAHLEPAWETLVRAEFSPKIFSPFTIDFGGGAGYSLLTLQIAVWALCWSIMKEPFPVPAGLPTKVFKKREGYTLGWIGLIGNDADTYGATAGPLIVAAHGELPASMRERLTDLPTLMPWSNE